MFQEVQPHKNRMTMITISVTEKAAEQINRIRKFEELEEMKSLLCDAYLSASSYMENNYSNESSMPLWAIRELNELIKELAINE